MFVSLFFVTWSSLPEFDWESLGYSKEEDEKTKNYNKDWFDRDFNKSLAPWPRNKIFLPESMLNRLALLIKNKGLHSE